MYNTQDMLRLVFASLLDGTLLDGTRNKVAAYSDLMHNVVMPFFLFVQKYEVLRNAGTCRVDFLDVLKTVNKLLTVYRNEHGYEDTTDISDDELFTLLDSIDVRYAFIRSQYYVFINKKIYDMLTDVSGK